MTATSAGPMTHCEVQEATFSLFSIKNLLFIFKVNKTNHKSLIKKCFLLNSVLRLKYRRFESVAVKSASAEMNSFHYFTWISDQTFSPIRYMYYLKYILLLWLIDNVDFVSLFCGLVNSTKMVNWILNIIIIHLLSHVIQVVGQDSSVNSIRNAMQEIHDNNLSCLIRCGSICFESTTESVEVTPELSVR